MPDTPERSDLTVDQHRMIASDATPSRVWLIPPPGDPTWYAGSWKSNPLTVVVGDVPYVPESALRAAESGRDVWMRRAEDADAKNQDDATQLANAINVERDKALREVMEQNASLRARVAALEAERDALVVLAKIGLNTMDAEYPPDEYPDSERVAAARAILGRVP